MNKHTPGPWHVDGHDLGSVIAGPYGPGNLYAHIARCEYGYQKHDQSCVEMDKANAALIAEAGTVATETGLTPRQLVEVLREVVRCHCIPSGPHCGNIVTGAMRSAASEHAIAILAKCGKVGG